MNGFVRTSGTGLTLDGNPFAVAGANNYYLAFASDAMVTAVFRLATEMGLNALRIWAFLDVPDATKTGAFFHYFDAAAGRPAFNDGPTGLERLDRTIALAEQHGIRLILPLVNYWPDFGGVDQYLHWFGLQRRDLFYRDERVRNAYREYVQHLLLRINTRTGRAYRDEPAILAWELANEPRCEGPNGKPLADGVQTLLAWVDEMSRFIRSLDTNHPIGVGDEGFFRRRLAGNHHLYNGSHGVDCEALLGIPNVDFGTCHLYPQFEPTVAAAEFGLTWIREHIEAGFRANKPMLIEEYGVTIGAEGGVPDVAARNRVFAPWLNEVEQMHGAGDLLWMIASTGDDGLPYPDYDHFTVYSAADVPGVVAHAAAMRNRAGIS